MPAKRPIRVSMVRRVRSEAEFSIAWRIVRRLAMG